MPAIVNVAQLVLNGIMAGAILSTPAIGFTAIYAVLRFPNFAVASHMTVGAFAGYVANVDLHWPLLPSALVAFAVAGATGVISDTVALRPLRTSGLIAATIASVALTIALENLIRLAFGNSLRDYDLPIQRDWRFSGLRVGPQQVQDLAISTAAVLALFGFLSFTRLGKAMRAVADNPVLASLRGIDTKRIGHLVNFTAMGMAGLGGMLLGLDTSIDPLTGYRAILAILGGLGSIPGAVLGALAIGVAEELSQLALPPDYRTVVGFLAILLVLSFRPAGILGFRN
jgi:branched-chain amino acid transport system permease protein